MRAPTALLLLSAAAAACKGEPERAPPPPPLPAHADCDGSLENGSETNTRTDPSHCGECHHSCEAGRGKAACVDGACRPSCEPGFAACGAPEQGCTTELATSLRHCGKCGAACESGYCRGGSCTDPKTVTTGLDAWRVAFSVGEDVFVSRNFSLPISSTTFWKLPSGGGAKIPVTVRGLYTLTTDGTHWYGCRTPYEKFVSDCRVARVPLAGGPVQDLAVVKGVDTVSGFAVDTGQLYLRAASGEGAWAIFSVPLVGGAARKLVEVKFVLHMAAGNGALVWTGSTAGDAPSHGIFVLREGARQPVKLSDESTDALTLADGYVYFVDSIAGVQRVALGGGEVQWLAGTGGRVGSGPRTQGIAVAAGFVHFGVESGSRLDVRRIEVPTASPTF